jgi:hypothetical protein
MLPCTIGNQHMRLIEWLPYALCHFHTRSFILRSHVHLMRIECTFNMINGQSCFNRSDRCIYWPEQGNCLPIFGAFSILLHVHCAPFLSFSTIYVLLQFLTLLAWMFWKGKGAFILGCTSPFKAIMIDRPGMGKVKNWRKSCAHCTKEPEKRNHNCLERGCTS